VSTESDKARAYAPRMVELGTSGVRRHGNYIYDDFLTALQGRSGRQKYREMAANEAVISASMRIFEALLQQTPWYVEATDKDDPQSVEVAEYIESCLNDMDGGMPAIVSRMLTAAIYGFAILEKVYKIRRGPDHPPPFRSMHSDGRWGIRKLPLRVATSIIEWIYEDDTGDEMLAAVQQSDSDAVRRILARDKIVHYRVSQKTESPEGASMLRGAYPSYERVESMRFVEAVGIERYMAGLPKATVPVDVMQAAPGTDQATTRAAYVDMVRKIRKDAQSGIVMPAETDSEGKPTGYTFELLGGGGERPADIDPVIKRYESRIAMVLLTEVMLLGSDAMGSYALSKDKTELLVVGLGAMLDSMYQALREQCLTELVTLNGWPAELTPTIKHGKIEAPNIADLGSFLTATSAAGLIIPGEASEEWAREQVGMPAETRESPAHIEASMVDGAAPAEGVAAELGEPGVVEDVAKTAMTGVQIDKLLQIAKDVAAGLVPREAAIGIIELAYQMSRADAERALAGIAEGATAPAPDTTTAEEVL